MGSRPTGFTSCHTVIALHFVPPISWAEPGPGSSAGLTGSVPEADWSKLHRWEEESLPVDVAKFVSISPVRFHPVVSADWLPHDDPFNLHVLTIDTSCHPQSNQYNQYVLTAVHAGSLGPCYRASDRKWGLLQLLFEMCRATHGASV